MQTKILTECARIIENTGDKYHMTATVNLIELSYQQSETGMMIGNVKAIIESVCKSILDEKKIEYEEAINLSQLAKKAVKSLEIANGVANEKKAREAFSKLINSFVSQIETSIHALGELRNDFCPLAHGKSNIHIPLDMRHAVFVVKQADSLMGFLYDVYENSKVLEKEIEEKISYVINDEINHKIDDEYGEIEIMGDIYTASEILYNIHYENYAKYTKFNVGEESD